MKVSTVVPSCSDRAASYHGPLVYCVGEYSGPATGSVVCGHECESANSSLSRSRSPPSKSSRSHDARRNTGFALSAKMLSPSSSPHRATCAVSVPLERLAEERIREGRTHASSSTPPWLGVCAFEELQLPALLSPWRGVRPSSAESSLNDTWCTIISARADTRCLAALIVLHSTLCRQSSSRAHVSSSRAHVSTPAPCRVTANPFKINKKRATEPRPLAREEEAAADMASGAQTARLATQLPDIRMSTSSGSKTARSMPARGSTLDLISPRQVWL